MSETTTKKEQLTITLTGRRPVKITKEDWPIVASAGDKEYDNQYEFQANRTAKWKLIVRQHQDGRTIVYGIYSYNSNFLDGRDYDIRAGEMVTVEGADREHVGDTAPIIAAIKRVGDDMERQMPDDGDVAWSKGHFPRLVRDCIADLPAEELI